MSRKTAIALAVVLMTSACLRAESGDPFPALVKKTKPAVVSILAFNPDEAMPRTATGFFVASDQVVSARHVFAGAQRAEVRTVAGDTLSVKGLLAEDLTWDVALVQLNAPASNIEALRISPALPEEGERIFAIGNPLGLEWTVNDGIVSALRSIPRLGVAIQHAVPVSPGSSGCPLMNMRGEVVGLQSGIITTEKQVVQAGQNLNFAVPCDRIAALKPGALRTLAECAKQVPVAWKPAVLSGVDQAGLRFLVRNDFRAAIAFFEEAVKRSPREADAWFRLGLCNDRCGNTDRAIEAYKKAIFLDLQYAMAFNNLGVAYVRQGKNAEAVQVLQAAIRLKPDFALGFANLADALNNLKQHREAAEAAKQAIRYNASLAPAHYHLGVACLHLGDRDAARAEYETLLKLNDKALADKLKALLDTP